VPPTSEIPGLPVQVAGKPRRLRVGTGVLHSSRLGVGVKPSSSVPQALRFGVFELDPRAGELRKKGMKIRLQEQSFQILTLLLERPGEVVTREVLQKRLWPADTFVDFDHSINAAVRRLRASLDDDAETPHFIETLPRRGYRFIGSVNSTGPTSATVISDDRQDSAINNLPEERKLQNELLLAFLYMRGQAHLLAHHGKEAAEEFQKIIDHRGVVPNLLLGVLAHLGLARAYALDGDTGKSRAEYEEFFGFFEGADSKIPIVQQAKMEYAKLR
jgi:DNA-binding winged helix-turn-helix (wHTH) protein